MQLRIGKYLVMYQEETVEFDIEELDYHDSNKPLSYNSSMISSSAEKPIMILENHDLMTKSCLEVRDIDHAVPTRAYESNFTQQGSTMYKNSERLEIEDPNRYPGFYDAGVFGFYKLKSKSKNKARSDLFLDKMVAWQSNDEHGTVTSENFSPFDNFTSFMIAVIHATIPFSKVQYNSLMSLIKHKDFNPRDMPVNYENLTANQILLPKKSMVTHLVPEDGRVTKKK